MPQYCLQRSSPISRCSHHRASLQMCCSWDPARKRSFSKHVELNYCWIWFLFPLTTLHCFTRVLVHLNIFRRTWLCFFLAEAVQEQRRFGCGSMCSVHFCIQVILQLFFSGCSLLLLSSSLVWVCVVQVSGDGYFPVLWTVHLHIIKPILLTWMFTVTKDAMAL